MLLVVVRTDGRKGDHGGADIIVIVQQADATRASGKGGRRLGIGMALTRSPSTSTLFGVAFRLGSGLGFSSVVDGL